jgi:hypothetical protein
MDGELYVVDDDDDWIPDLVMLDICQSGWARMQILATQDH